MLPIFSLLITLASLAQAGRRAGGDLPEILYVTRANVPSIDLVPIGRTVGAPVRISPTRLAAYGVDEGTVELLAAPERGDRVVLLLHTREGAQRLYTVSTSGEDAERPLLRYTFEDHVGGGWAFTEDGTRFAFVDGPRLVAVNTDGPPRTSVLYEAAPGTKIREVGWAGERVVYNVDQPNATGGTSAALYAIDGAGGRRITLGRSDAAEQHRAIATLPDGQVIMSRSHARYRVLYRVNPTNGDAARLTPEGAFAGLEGIVGGQAIVRTSPLPSSALRRLARVALDGSNADAPVAITDPVEDLTVVVSERLVAWVQKTGPETWAVFALPQGQPTARRLTPDLQRRPTLEAVTASGDAVVGCDGEGAIARFDLGREPAEPVRLGPMPWGRRCGFVGLAGKDRILFIAEAAPGTQENRVYAVRLDGSDTTELGPPAATLVPGGALVRRDEVGASLWRSGGTRLGEEHAVDVSETHLAPGGRAVIYRADAWRVLDLETGRDTPRPELAPDATFLGANADYAVFGPTPHWIALGSTASGQTPCDRELVLLASGGCLAYDERLGALSFHRFGSEGSEPVMALPTGTSPLIRHDPLSGRIVAVFGDSVWSVDVWPGHPERTAEVWPKPIDGFGDLDPGRPGFTQPLGLYDAELLPGGQTLVITLATVNTSIPHPMSSQLIPLRGGAPSPYPFGLLPFVPSSSERIVLAGQGGLYLASPADDDAPALLAQGPPEALDGAPLSPDGRWLAWRVGKELAVADLASGETRRLPLLATWAAWSPNAAHLVFQALDGPYALLAGSAAPHPIARDLARPTLVAVALHHAIVSTGSALYAAPLDGGPSARLTPEAATSVSFMGLVQP